MLMTKSFANRDNIVFFIEQLFNYFIMSILTEIIGYIAAAFGTALMLPQVYKSYRTKRVNDISFVMLIVYILNCTSWEIYGILINSKPVIICNFLALIIGIFQMVLKLKLQNKNKL